MKVTVKEVLDDVFKDIKYDKNLFKKINYVNLQLILKNENKNLFGSQLIGCYPVKYITSDKSDFFEFIFDMNYEDIDDAIKRIDTIPKEFKVARDSINLVCFYTAHRFLSNKDLTKEERIEYATEILNYFNYRTLLVLSSSYFVYPISEEEAISLIELLSNKYIIKKLKNWKEYCEYRSEEYLKSKFYDLLLTLNDDKALPNAINDLFLRTKDTIKNIYREFINLHESNEYLVKRKNIMSDIEGKEVLVDKFTYYDKIYHEITSRLNDRNSFINTSLMDVTVNIIKNLSFKNLNECLNIMFDYTHLNHKNYEKVLKEINNIVVYTFSYLQRNNIYLSDNVKVIDILNIVVGNLLYSRSLDKEIDNIKNNLIKIIKEAYKEIKKESISNKLVNNLKNAFFIYILLRGMIT